ncbi:MAG: hypothetical protein AAGI68_17185, partial [Planctomycetota bacterium]
LRHGYLGCPLEEIAYRMTSAFAAGLGDAGPVGREVAEDADTQGAVLRDRGWLHGVAWWLAGAW